MNSKIDAKTKHTPHLNKNRKMKISDIWRLISNQRTKSFNYIQNYLAKTQSKSNFEKMCKTQMINCLSCSRSP